MLNITPKPSKLIFRREESVWTKTIQTLEGNVIWHEETPIIEDDMNSEYFDDWETMTKSLPHFNIVEVERFV
jgi:hypothetical protein